MATCFPVELGVPEGFCEPTLSREPSVAPALLRLAESWELGVPEFVPGLSVVTDPSAIKGMVASINFTSCSAVGSTCE
jgi:hypothetical protein